jgi:nucleoside phosphorylase
MDSTQMLADVCIVCALEQEARAFLNAGEHYAHLSWSQGVNHRHGYDYRCATLMNVNGEPVRLHVSWLPWHGPQEMVLHLSHVIEEYRPRLAVMTGICAGDKRHVFLGDLVVAERTFTYDNGKVVKDEYGQPVYLHDTLTYQLHENIKRFVDSFEQWQAPAQLLPRPSSKREQRDWLLETLSTQPAGSLKAIPLATLETHAPHWRQLVEDLQQGPQPWLSLALILHNKEAVEHLRYGRVPFPFRDPPGPGCHIRPLASGSAVRSDDPFKALQVPVRGAVAIDMEGAAFSRVLESFPGVEWFIVKGVSDYADHEKDDSYHLYASTVSAVYALYFMQAYVTQQRLPSQEEPSAVRTPDEGLLSLAKGSQALWDGSYGFAKKALRQAVVAIDEECHDKEASQARYFLALALLGGKLPRIQGREIIQRIEDLLEEAISIHPYASYYRVLARIKKDFFEYNGFNHRSHETSLLEKQGASCPRCREDEEHEAYFRQSQPRLPL